MSEFGKYDVYAMSGSIYCYKDTNVLKNRFGIRDGGVLKKIDADISLLKQKSLLTNPVSGRFTANHLCMIHKYMFEDIYPFAGHFRREDIMKGETRFLAHTQIKSKLQGLLLRLKEEDFLEKLSYEAFIERSAYYFAELNYIHPFREGNGRAIREFMRLLFLHNGFDVSWSGVANDVLLHAMEESVYDINSLQKVLKICISPKQ